MSLSKDARLVELRRLVDIQSRLLVGRIPEEDVLFVKEKADSGIPRAQFMYAHLLTYGLVVKLDFKTARKYLDLAFDKAGHDVLNLMADLYFIQGDLEKFKECMKKAHDDLESLDLGFEDLD